MPIDAIRTAINELRLLQFTYVDKEDNLHRRIVEPYVYGRTRAGKGALRAYQVGGSSETALPGWRLFLVDNMRDIGVVTETFDGTAPGYARDDKALSTIYCQV